MDVTELLKKIDALILNPIIKLAFAVALLVFFWGIFQFIMSETGDTKRKEGQKKIWYGLLGMFIMVSVYDIIRVILGTFGIPAPGFIPV